MVILSTFQPRHGQTGGLLHQAGRRAADRGGQVPGGGGAQHPVANKVDVEWGEDCNKLIHCLQLLETRGCPGS